MRNKRMDFSALNTLCVQETPRTQLSEEGIKEIWGAMKDKWREWFPTTYWDVDDAEKGVNKLLLALGDYGVVGGELVALVDNHFLQNFSAIDKLCHSVKSRKPTKGAAEYCTKAFKLYDAICDIRRLDRCGTMVVYQDLIAGRSKEASEFQDLVYEYSSLKNLKKYDLASEAGYEAIRLLRDGSKIRATLAAKSFVDICKTLPEKIFNTDEYLESFSRASAGYSVGLSEHEESMTKAHDYQNLYELCEAMTRNDAYWEVLEYMDRLDIEGYETRYDEDLGKTVVVDDILNEMGMRAIWESFGMDFEKHFRKLVEQLASINKAMYVVTEACSDLTKLHKRILEGKSAFLEAALRCLKYADVKVSQESLEDLYRDPRLNLNVPAQYRLAPSDQAQRPSQPQEPVETLSEEGLADMFSAVRDLFDGIFGNKKSEKRRYSDLLNDTIAKLKGADSSAVLNAKFDSVPNVGGDTADEYLKSAKILKSDVTKLSTWVDAVAKGATDLYDGLSDWRQGELDDRDVAKVFISSLGKLPNRPFTEGKALSCGLVFTKDSTGAAVMGGLGGSKSGLKTTTVKEALEIVEALDGIHSEFDFDHDGYGAKDLLDTFKEVATLVNKEATAISDYGFTEQTLASFKEKLAAWISELAMASLVFNFEDVYDENVIKLFTQLETAAGKAGKAKPQVNLSEEGLGSVLTSLKDWFFRNNNKRIPKNFDTDYATVMEDYERALKDLNATPELAAAGKILDNEWLAKERELVSIAKNLGIDLDIETLCKAQLTELRKYLNSQVPYWYGTVESGTKMAKFYQQFEKLSNKVDQQFKPIVAGAKTLKSHGDVSGVAKLLEEIYSDIEVLFGEVSTSFKHDPFWEALESSVKPHSLEQFTTDTLSGKFAHLSSRGKNANAQFAQECTALLGLREALYVLEAAVDDSGSYIKSLSAEEQQAFGKLGALVHMFEAFESCQYCYVDFMFDEVEMIVVRGATKTGMYLLDEFEKNQSKK